MGLTPNDIIGAVVALVIGLALLGVVITFSNATTIGYVTGDPEFSLLGLIPIVYILVLVVGLATYLTIKARN